MVELNRNLFVFKPREFASFCRTLLVALGLFQVSHYIQKKKANKKQLSFSIRILYFNGVTNLKFTYITYLVMNFRVLGKGKMKSH